MDLWEVIIIGFRRWYVSVPLLVLGVLGAMQVADGIDPVFKAETQAIYLSPTIQVDVLLADEDPDEEIRLEDEEIETAINPLANRRDAALLQKFNGEATQVKRDFKDLGLSTNYTITVDRRDPIMQFEVEATSSDQAVDTLQALSDLLVTDLDQRQADFGIDARERVKLEVVNIPESADADFTSATRTRFILFGLAGIAAFGAAVALEGLLSYLRRRRDPEADAAIGPDQSGWPAGMLVQVPPGWAPPAQQYPRPITAHDPVDEPAELLDEGDDDGVVRRSGSRWRRAEG